MRESKLEGLEKIRNAGQSLWMDHVAREHIRGGSLLHYIDSRAITGIFLTPQAICQTLRNSTAYEDDIIINLKDGVYGEKLAFDLIIEDIHHAADLLRHVYDRTDSVDGWASFPVSPLLTGDTGSLLDMVLALHVKINRPNVLVTVPGLTDSLWIIEEIVFAGIPVNISLIFFCDQYDNAVGAYLRGIDRRIRAGLKTAVPAFITVPIFNLATALAKEMPREETARIVTAIARVIYKKNKTLRTSKQWAHAYNAGARPLRLIWSVSDDEPVNASDVSPYDYQITPFTVAAMSEQVVTEFFNHGYPEVPMSTNIDNCEEVLAGYQKAGLDLSLLANSIQGDAAAKQVKTWITLLDAVARKCADAAQAEFGANRQRRIQMKSSNQASILADFSRKEGGD
jgi:transaldolase